MGLVETGVGLIPGSGGTKELLPRLHAPSKEHGPFPRVRKAFETISFAIVGTSAAKALGLGYPRRSDKITLDRDRLLHDAKADAIALVESGWRSSSRSTDSPRPARSARTTRTWARNLPTC